MIKFAKSLKPGDMTIYGQVVANQLLWTSNSVQLTIAGQSKNLYLSKYSILRVR